MNAPLNYFSSSIGRKQIVAITGLFLILFVIGHLAGNLLIYLGPQTFNAYAEKLAHLRPGLYLIEFALLIIFIVHMYVTALLVIDNIKARGKGYKVERQKRGRSLATRLMPYTGTLILIFVIIHLLDFTFVDKTGPLSYLPDGQSYGLYGIVYNSFADPLHSVIYVLAMCALGLHLSHGIQSFSQTFGITRPGNAQHIQNWSNGLAVMISAAYSSIPVYVLIQSAGM